MRLIKLALISFVFFFLLITGISLLIPSHIRISKAIDIKADPHSILSLIKDTTKWSQWHPGFIADPNTAQRGTAPLSIKLQKANDSIIVMQFEQDGKKPMQNGWQLYSFSSTDTVTLQWYMDFYLPWYPWQKFGTLFYEDTYGAMMKKGLTNIKSLAEHQGSTY